MKLEILTNRDQRKEVAKRYILNLIHKEGSLSQSEIVEKTKIRPGTVLNITEELLEEKLIRVKGQGESSGGRRPTLLELDSDAHWTVSLDIDEVRIMGGLVNLKGEVLNQKKRDGYIYQSQKELIDCIMKIIDALISESYDKQRIIGIGMGIPGLVDRERGVGLYCSYYDWWRNLPLKSLLEKKFKFPVHVENDTIAATLGERWFGAGKDVKNFLYLNLEETIGMGIVIEGHPYYGTGGSAGELGHTIIKEDGPLCICGNEGCVEALASGMAIRKKAQRLLREGVKSLITDEVKEGGETTLETIIRAVSKGDKVASKLIYDTGIHLGIAISNMVNVLNPELIILGGSLMGAKEMFTETIVKSIKTHCLAKPSSEVRVVTSKLGEKSGVLGASTLVTKQLFEFS